MKDTVENFVHKGSRVNSLYKDQYKPDLSRCRFSVYEYGRAADWHQCYRKPVEEIDGYGFCKAHAGEVKSKLGIHQKTTEKYAACFQYGKPSILKLSVIEETESTINVESVEKLMGDAYGISLGKQRKNSQYTNKFEFFNEFTDAIAWLYEKSENYVQSTFQAYEDAIRVRNKLESEFMELSPKE